VFFSRGVDKASNVSRNFNRPSSPVFELKKNKKSCRERKFFFLKKQQKKNNTELKNICDYTTSQTFFHIRARTEDARATKTRACGGSSFGLNNPSFFFLSVERFLSFGF
jgi:hypothetical protein